MDGELDLFYHQQHYLSLNQVRAAYSKEALTKMQGSLWREGWKEVEGLPPGWRTRFFGLTGEHSFLTEEGKVVRGAKEAELVLGQGDQLDLVLAWIGRSDMGKEVKDTKSLDWKPRVCLPKGWKLAEDPELGSLVMDTRGVVVGGMREGIQQMIVDHSSPADIFR